MVTEEVASVLIELAEELRAGAFPVEDINKVVLERVGGITSPTLIRDLVSIAACAVIVAQAAWSREQLEMCLLGVKIDAPSEPPTT